LAGLTLQADEAELSQHHLLWLGIRSNSI